MRPARALNLYMVDAYSHHSGQQCNGILRRRYKDIIRCHQSSSFTAVHDALPENPADGHFSLFREMLESRVKPLSPGMLLDVNHKKDLIMLAA
jgi:hypothetical protein